MVVAIVAVWVILSNGLLDDATKSGRIAVSGRSCFSRIGSVFDKNRREERTRGRWT